MKTSTWWRQLPSSSQSELLDKGEKKQCVFLMQVALCTFCKSSERGVEREEGMNSEAQLWIFYLFTFCVS